MNKPLSRAALCFFAVFFLGFVSKVLPAHTSLAGQAIIIDGKANTLTVKGGELYRLDAGGEENIVE